MLVLLQFPIADLRSFLDREDTRVAAATGFAASVEQSAGFDINHATQPFIRNMGPLRTRNQGLRIAGESLYFRGRNGLRFAAGLHAVADPRGGAPIGLRVVFRRFQAYCDALHGNVHRLAKYELAWLLDVARTGQPPLSPPQLHQLLDSCLALPVAQAQYDAPAPEHRSADILVRAGDRIARQLRWSTVTDPAHAASLPDDWTVQARKPALLVEYGQAELAGTPLGAGAVSFASAPDITLFCRERQIGQRAVQCWYLNTGVPKVDAKFGACDVDAEHVQQARNLRVAVLRQHAEREVLSYALYCVAQPGRLQVDEPGAAAAAMPSTPARAQLQDYLLRSAALLRRRGRASRQLPIAGDADRLEPAALVVDEADPDRFQKTSQRLTMVLGAELMSELRTAVNLLPMGELEEDIEIGKLVQAHRPRPLKLAVSYSHKDEGLLQSFKASTQHDALAGIVDRWDDLRIAEGSDWHAEILERFSQADVLVLLLSPDFLRSAFCMGTELPLALQRHAARQAAVIPVEAIACDWARTALAQLQVVRPYQRAVTAGGDRDAAWRFVRHKVYFAASQLFAKAAMPA